MRDMKGELNGFGKKETGKRAEDIALSYLENLGLKFVTRNWHNRHNELDIIMEDDVFIRFIEVRSLVYPNMVEPFETIGIQKQRKIIKAARAFMGMYNIKKEVVFDVVSVVFNVKSFKIEYIVNAFTPLW